MPAVAIKKVEEAPAEEFVNPNVEGEMVNGLWNGKYKINDPRKVKFVERTDFIKSICGHIDMGDSLVDLIRAWNATTMREHQERVQLRDLAQTYYMLSNKGARLPKFSRWVTGMFTKNKNFAKWLAEEGQKAANRKLIISGDLLDILRNADTPHFVSCFGWDNPSYRSTGYAMIPTKIAEQCPGIGIIYVDDENGKMMGRHWLHHAKIRDTGEDIIVLTQSRYGCLEHANVARLLMKRGIKVAYGSYYGDPVRGDNVVAVDYVGCFTKEIHHDLATWQRNPCVQIVPPAF